MDQAQSGRLQTLTTDCVRSMSAVTVFFRCLSLAGASVKRNSSELEGALAKASCRGREGVTVEISQLKTTATSSLGGRGLILLDN